MEDGPESKRLVEFTEAALLDLANIDNFTANTWGDNQADLYTEFLADGLRKFAEEPTKGNVIAQFPDLRIAILRFSSARNAHGHRVIYRVTPTAIRVIRLLHTAMRWEDHISSD